MLNLTILKKSIVGVTGHRNVVKGTSFDSINPYDKDVFDVLVMFIENVCGM